MSTKTICDGCGKEIPPWKQQDPSAGDGLMRKLVMITGHNEQSWDLCDPCQGRVADAIAEALPHTPRESWYPAIRPTKRA